MKVAIALLALLAGLGSPARAGQVHGLTLFHTNGLQGQLLPGPYFDEGERGGFARLCGLLRAADSSAALVVDSGDALGPALLSRFDGGQLAWELMREVGYDAVVAGNHEFDFGLDTLQARAAAGPPLLGANISVAGTRPFAPYLLAERQGLRIALIGLTSPEVQKIINPRRNPGVVIAEPQAALRQALEELKGRADYFIALVHMSEEEAYQLAGNFPEVQLFVAGGFRRPHQKGATTHLRRLASGTRLVTTPGSAFVGRLDLAWQRGEGGIEEQGFRAALIPLDSAVAEEGGVAARIAAQAAAFARARSGVVGRASEEIADTPQFMADLLKARLRAEVGMINRGTLWAHPLRDTITEADVDRLIRFDDLLAKVWISGAELRRVAASSKARAKDSQRLVFSGYDEAADRVNGRPLNPAEIYKVATTAYLAGGGDEYLQPGVRRSAREQPTLRETLVQHLQAHPDLRRRDGLEGLGGAVWKSQTKLSGSLARTGINAAAGQYRGVAFLGGEEAMAWNSLIDSQVSREAAGGTLAAHLRSSFGQVQNEGRFKEAADRLQTEVVYTWQQKHPAPFVSLDVNTVWTVPPQTPRPLTLRGSAGLHRSLGKDAKVRIGVGVDQNLARHRREVGIEVVPEYQRQLGKGNSLSSNLKLFASAAPTRRLSIQHYNSLLVHLVGNLYTTIDANFFLHRDSQVEKLAFKSELQVGLGYTWEKKWF